MHVFFRRLPNHNKRPATAVEKFHLENQTDWEIGAKLVWISELYQDRYTCWSAVDCNISGKGQKNADFPHYKSHPAVKCYISPYVECNKD